MIGATRTLANLLADCDARGIRLLLAGDGGLTIDAPQDALTPELIGRLKAHKADLLRARADVGAGDEPVQIEDNRDELSADNFPGDFNADGWPANTVELLPPCPKCGSLDYWQNLLGD